MLTGIHTANSCIYLEYKSNSYNHHCKKPKWKLETCVNTSYSAPDKQIRRDNILFSYGQIHSSTLDSFLPSTATDAFLQRETVI